MMDEGSYIDFGEKKLFIWIILKWLLILDMLQRHANLELSLFSDSDIKWRKNIKLRNVNKLSGEKVLANQDHSRGRDGVFYFLDIMIWRETSNSGKSI